jgi:hypothetical protein
MYMLVPAYSFVIKEIEKDGRMERWKDGRKGPGEECGAGPWNRLLVTSAKVMAAFNQ